MRCNKPTILGGIAIIVIATGPLATTSAFAQDNILEEIIVTATRREETLQDVPISVATLSGEAYEALFTGGEDILALSGRVPGLYAESSNGRSAPRFYMRGLGNIDFDLAASQPVSVVMDEVVMENVVLKGFPLFDMENVEIIRGPQGTLFGRNTTAGIIKFNTRRPTDETEGYASASIGTYNTMNLEGAISGALVDDVLKARVSVLHRSRDNWISNGYTGEKDVMGDYTETAGRVQLDWTPSDTFGALLSIQARSLEGTSSIFRANVFDTGSNRLNQNYDRDTVYYNEGDNNPQEYDGLGITLTLDWDIGDMTLTSITSQQEADGFSRGDIDGGVVDFSGTATVPPGITFDPAAPVFGGTALTFPGTITVPSVTQDGADVEQFTQEFRLASSAEDALRWQVGYFYFDSSLEVETDSFASFGFVDVQNTIIEQDNTTWAVFGQAAYDVSDQMTVTAGVRYTDDEKDFRVNQFGQLWLDLEIPTFIADPINVSDDNVSWDLSLNYAVADNSSVYGRVSSGFRAQTIQGRDVAFLETPTVAVPETILSFEAGYKADLMNDRVRLNVGVFHYTVDDMQLSIIGGATNTNQVINAKEGVGMGFEVDLQALITDNFLVTAGIGYNDTEINDPNLYTRTCGSGLCTPTDPVNPADETQVSLDGNPFPRAPKTSYNLTASYTVPFGSESEMFVFGDWSMQGKINMPLYESLEFVTKDQWELGLRAGYRNLVNNWEVAVFGRNITDEDNVRGFIDFSNNTGFVNEPSVWGLEARIDFGN